MVVVGALVVVLVIGAFVGMLLSRNGLPLGGRLTGVSPIGQRAAPSVYVVADKMLYAINASGGTSRWQTPAEGAYNPEPVVANDVVTARRASDDGVLWSKLVVRAEGKRLALAGDTLYMTTDMIGGQVLFPGYVHGVYALRASDGCCWLSLALGTGVLIDDGRAIWLTSDAKEPRRGWCHGP